MENKIREEIENYLEYFKHYFLNLSKVKKSKIKKFLIENQICPIKTDENGMPLDNTKNDVDTFIMESFLENEKAILTYQKYELFQNYKYSIFYKIEHEDIKSLIKAIKDKNDLFVNVDSKIEEFIFFKDNEENSLNIDKNIGYHIEDDKVYFKFPIGLEKFDKTFYQIVKTKMLFLCIIDLNHKILEIRYEGLSQPFKTNQEFYIKLGKKIINYITYELKLKLKTLDLQFVAREIEPLKNLGYKIIKREAHFSDAGSASLGSNNENMLPYIDDFKNFLKSKIKEFEDDSLEQNIAEEMGREILDFFNEKEDESSYVNVILEIHGYRTHFNYIDKEDIQCVVQHEYINPREEDRRGDYVRTIILQLERQFNYIGNKEE